MQQDGALAGYLAVQPQPAAGRLFISKLYLHRNARGRGTGRAAMEFIEETARQRGLGLHSLTVNKENPSVQAYQRMGFEIAEFDPAIRRFESFHPSHFCRIRLFSAEQAVGGLTVAWWAAQDTPAGPFIVVGTD